MEKRDSYVPCQILSLRRKGKYLVCRFHANWPDKVVPGQFMMVRIPGASQHLLGRPFCVAQTGPEWTEFAAAVVGKGTSLLSESLVVNGHVEILGPLGRGFNVSTVYRRIALIGGGVGIAELCLLAQELHTQGRSPVFFAGARTVDDLIYISEVSPFVTRMEIATEDGTSGTHGLVTRPLAESLKRHEFDLLVGCGPIPMLKAVAEAAEAASIESLVALEERMACGIGACFGCAVPLAVKGRVKMVRVCKEGPVFRGKSFLGGLRHAGRD
ncbi:MAG: dihydroorotate dehydrogenase electron transfer subunit [Candidatus Brocadiia bacterium]